MTVWDLSPSENLHQRPILTMIAQFQNASTMFAVENERVKSAILYHPWHTDRTLFVPTQLQGPLVSSCYSFFHIIAAVAVIYTFIFLSCLRAVFYSIWAFVMECLCYQKSVFSKFCFNFLEDFDTAHSYHYSFLVWKQCFTEFGFLSCMQCLIK